MEDTDSLKKRVEDILSREWNTSKIVKPFYLDEYNRIGKKNHTMEEYSNFKLFYLSKDMPELMNRGESQAVFRINEWYVAKIPVIDFSEHMLLHIYVGDIAQSTNTWRELGFNVPEHEFYHILLLDDKAQLYKDKAFASDRTRAVITPDLTQNGRYDVKTYDVKSISKLRNFGELYGEYQESYDKINDIFESPGEYLLQPTGHFEKDPITGKMKIDKAIRRMFLVQIDPIENTGKLILGDVDHLLLYK